MPIARSGPEVARLAVGIFSTQDGFHVGLLHRRGDEPVRVLHLAWHHHLRHEEADNRWGWVVPALEEERLRQVGAFARLVASRHADGKVPYALAYPSAPYFSQTGHTASSVGNLGLTCATFVLELFARHHVNLLERATWESRSADRVAEDIAAQHKLVELLRREVSPEAQRHAEAVEAQVGCTRFRPEEVAASCADATHPVPFERASSLGVEVVSAFRARVAA